MATITFPFTGYLNNGYQEEIQTSYVENTPDAGIPFRRETFSDFGKSVTGTKLVDNLEMQQFMSFYRVDTRSGTRSFNYYDCINDVTRTAKFIGKPSVVRNSNKWNISFQLYLEPVKIIQTLNLVAENGDNLVAENGDNLVADVEFTV